jgi:hypothetical protein
MDHKFSFNQLQSQQPQTLAHALADSPVGLLGWNTQLMTPDVMGAKQPDKDFILTNAALYWFTNTGGSSVRSYYEDAHGKQHPEPTTVPLGVAGFSGDFAGVRRFAERDHTNLVQWNIHPEPGGHYAAHPGARRPSRRHPRFLPSIPVALPRTRGLRDVAGRRQHSSSPHSHPPRSHPHCKKELAMPTLPWTIPNPATPGTQAYAMASRFEVRSAKDVPRFFLKSLAAWRQVRSAPGCLGASLNAQPLRRVFYTLSAWQNRDALYTFAATQPHRDIMASLRPTMRSATFTCWEAPTEQLPLTWHDAQQRLADQTQADRASASHTPRQA